MRSRTLVATCLAAVGSAWGPYTHQFLGSKQQMYSSSAEFRCGCSAPDAFKSAVPALHSSEFAYWMFEAAAANGSKNLTNFALGFGCHLAQDAVGHHAAGFLNPMEDHPLELATDAYVVEGLSGGSVDFFENSLMDQNNGIQTLVLQASQLSTATSPQAGQYAISASQVSSSVSKFRILTTSERAALALDKLLYKRQMVSDSFCNVSGNFDIVAANFKLALNWTLSSCAAWQNIMQGGSGGAPRAPPSQFAASAAAAALTKHVDNLFRTHSGTSCI